MKDEKRSKTTEKEVKKQAEDFGKYCRTVEDFPKKGISFKDITTLLLDGGAYKRSIQALACQFAGKIDIVVCIEARGFLIGSPVAYELGVGFVPVRKKGKLPSKCVDLTYKKEYESDTIQIHEDAISKGQNVLILDDLLATGGTVKANIDLVEKLGGKVAGIGFLVELGYLDGRKLLGDKYDVFSLIEFKTATDI